MKSEEWAQIEALFHEALAKTETERAAFLDRVCGANIKLRAQIETLIAQTVGSTDSFEQGLLHIASESRVEVLGSSDDWPAIQPV